MKKEETEHAVVLAPDAPASGTVIWLHGLGADGHDLAAIVPELRLGDVPVRFVFPHAPQRPITINGGARMRAWYDIPSLTTMRGQDEAGIRDSERILLSFVSRETGSGIPPERIVLAGFSQGGAIALHTGLRHPQRLAGILAMSTYVPLAEQFTREARPERKDTPILMCHGEHDAVLPIELGAGSRDLLVDRGYEVDWHQYPMQHSVCNEEIDLIAAWLRHRLVAPSA